MKTLMCVVGALVLLLAATNAGNTGGGDYEDTDYDDNADDTKHNTNIEISCKNDTDCGYPSGYCREHHDHLHDPLRYICLCEDPYFSVKESEPCQEKRKSKLMAFMLSFFLGLVGADWFYLSNGRSANTLAHIFILLNLKEQCPLIKK